MEGQSFTIKMESACRDIRRRSEYRDGRVFSQADRKSLSASRSPFQAQDTLANSL